MLRALCLFVTVLFPVSCALKVEPLEEDVIKPISVEDVLKKPNLKVLDIGNSYSEDALALLPKVADFSEVDVKDMCLYKLIRGGGSLKNWCYTYYDMDTYHYSFRKVIGDAEVPVDSGVGEAGDGSLFRSVLHDVEWDIIIIHQLSKYAPYYEEWRSNDSNGGYLDELLGILKDNQPKALIGFMIVHSYWDDYDANKEKSSYARWQRIADSVQKLQEDYPEIKIIIPYGTAIENLRSSSLNNDYDLTRDGAHCGFGLCQYTAACCYYETIIAPRCGVSCYGQQATIDVLNYKSKYPPVSVTSTNAIIAQRAAILATNDMYHCNNPDEVFNISGPLTDE